MGLLPLNTKKKNERKCWYSKRMRIIAFDRSSPLLVDHLFDERLGRKLIKSVDEVVHLFVVIRGFLMLHYVILTPRV